MKVIIAGSRHLVGNYALQLVYQAVEASGWMDGLTEVVSGGAPGIDQAGERFARALKLPVKVFPADWRVQGLGAGPRRNREMAAYADALVAIPHPDPARHRGTANMIGQMEAAGKPVYVHREGLPVKGHGRKDRDDADLFGDEAEADRARLAEAGYHETRPGWWVDAAGAEWAEADALKRVQGGGTC